MLLRLADASIPWLPRDSDLAGREVPPPCWRPPGPGGPGINDIPVLHPLASLSLLVNPNFQALSHILYQLPFSHLGRSQTLKLYSDIISTTFKVGILIRL